MSSQGEWVFRDCGFLGLNEFQGECVPRGGGSQRAVGSQEQWDLRVIKGLSTKENHRTLQRGKLQTVGFQGKWVSGVSGPRRIVEQLGPGRSQGTGALR